MGLKDLFWKSDEEDGAMPPSSDVSAPPQTPPQKGPAMRPQKIGSSSQPPSANPMAALRQGPSASLFTRATGLQAMPAVSAPAATTTSVDAEFNQVISDSLKNDSREPGFVEFLAQFQVLASFIPDKGQCAKAALSAVAANNSRLSTSQIIRAIEERLQLLSAYTASYEADCRKSEQSEMEQRGGAVEEAKSRIQELEQEIARLAAERAQLDARLGSLQSEVAGVAQKYGGYRQRFKGAVEAHRQQLTEMKKIVGPSNGAPEKE